MSVLKMYTRRLKQRWGFAFFRDVMAEVVASGVIQGVERMK